MISHTQRPRQLAARGDHICKCFINSSKTSIVRHRNSHSRGFTGLSAQHSSELRRRWIIRIFPHSCCRHSSPAKKNQREKILKAAAGAVNDAFYDLSIHTFKVARQLGYALETSEMKSSQRGAWSQLHDVTYFWKLFKYLSKLVVMWTRELFHLQGVSPVLYRTGGVSYWNEWN